MTNPETDPGLTLLVVDDDEVDTELAQRAVRRVGKGYDLQISHNGEEALRCLREATEEADEPRPDVILLDLNMPVMNGFEFLEVVKQDTELRKIPVVVVSTSDTARDVDKSFEMGAAGYLVKSIDLSEFNAAIRCLCEYWTVSRHP